MIFCIDIMWLWWDSSGMSLSTGATQVSIIIASQWLTIAQSRITKTSHPYKKKSRRDIHLRIWYVIMWMIEHKCAKNGGFSRGLVLATHNTSIPPLIYNNTLRTTYTFIRLRSEVRDRPPSRNSPDLVVTTFEHEGFAGHAMMEAYNRLGDEPSYW